MNFLGSTTEEVPITKHQCQQKGKSENIILVQALVSGLSLGYQVPVTVIYKCGSLLYIKALSSNTLWVTCYLHFKSLFFTITIHLKSDLTHTLSFETLHKTTHLLKNQSFQLDENLMTAEIILMKAKYRQRAKTASHSNGEPTKLPDYNSAIQSLRSKDP